MMLYLYIAIGGALGSVLRHFLSTLLQAQVPTVFPWATLFVNATGSLFIGILFYACSPEGIWGEHSAMKPLLVVGFCGGYTTFSAFSLQMLHLLRDGQWILTGAYALASVLLCCFFVMLGYWVAKSI